MRGIIANNMMKNEKAIKNLTLTDFSVWSGSNLITVIFSLFVITQIPGATITDAGIASMIYLSMSALTNIPLGKFMDSRKGLVDETLVQIASNLIRGVALIALAFTTSIWILYLGQVILGIAKSMNTTSWRILFSKFLDTEHMGKQWGVYDTIMSIGLGVASFLGGFMADHWGFQIVIIIGGVMSIVGAFFTMASYKDIKRIS